MNEQSGMYESAQLSEVHNQAHGKYFESSIRFAEMSDEHVTVLFSSSAGSLYKGVC